ncbi:hypothetical protein Tco_1036314 [Tanacetum coccineum]
MEPSIRERSISRIKSSSRLEVTIPNQVFCCSEFGGVTNIVYSIPNIDNPNINIAEYIQLEEEKAHRRGQEFNWETATYGKVRYFEDIDYFNDFENEFLAIVYKDALTP